MMRASDRIASLDAARQAKLDFAVVIPLYNKARFIRRTLETVLAQRHAAAEVIIVDDASTDGGPDVIADLLDDRVRLVRQANSGPGPARNRGVAESTAPWIAFIDADDLWSQEHLATLTDLIRHNPEAHVVGADFRIASDIPVYGCKNADLPVAGQLIRYFSLAGSSTPLWTSTTAVSRTSFLQVGGFGDVWPGEDRDLWARLALRFAIATCPRITAHYVPDHAGIMHSQSVVGHLPHGGLAAPIYKTIDNALSDPIYLELHDDLRLYKTALLTQNVRQSLVSFDRRFTSLLLQHLKPLSLIRYSALLIISFIPVRVFGYILDLYRSIRVISTHWTRLR